MAVSPPSTVGWCACAHGPWSATDLPDQGLFVRFLCGTHRFGRARLLRIRTAPFFPAPSWAGRTVLLRVGYPPVPENRKPSPRQPARLPRCSTMRCVTVWITSIRGHHITRPAIGSGLSKIYIGVPRPSDSFCKQQRCRPPSRPFLRKVAALLGPPAESDGGS